MALLNLKATSQAGQAGPKEPGSLTRRWSRLNQLPGAADSGRRRSSAEALGWRAVARASSHSDCQGGGRRADTKRRALLRPLAPLALGAPLSEKGPAPWRQGTSPKMAPTSWSGSCLSSAGAGLLGAAV